MARKSTIEKLKTRISVLEKDRQRKVDEQIELILKTDPEILQINSQIDDLKKMVKASEELERKKEELEKTNVRLTGLIMVGCYLYGEQPIKRIFSKFNETKQFKKLQRIIKISKCHIRNYWKYYAK